MSPIGATAQIQLQPEEARFDGVPAHPGLDRLVTRIASRFMDTSEQSLQGALRWALQEMGQYFEVDTSFLRRNDHAHGLSILAAEWPERQDVPDPDPLGVVPFSADPVFGATRTLTAPFVLVPGDDPDPYQARVEQGAGVPQVSMSMVPLISGGETVGVLGFIKFGQRPWSTAELNALEAVASLLVQLQARVDAEHRLVLQAHQDELTKLPNRRALAAAIDARPADVPTAILFIDLDGFKSINDSLGHIAGDDLLVAIAERLSRITGAAGLVARLAGDEFVVMLGTDDPRMARWHAEALLQEVGRPVELLGHVVTQSASIGIAIASAVAAEELVERADIAVRAAKRAGGGRTVVFDHALEAAARERSALEIGLRDALARDQFVLHYQPEVDLRSGDILGVEALVRWEHPTRGLLVAGEFIGVAEETGLIVEIGNGVLRQACRQASEWRAAGFDIVVRINLSPAQFRSAHIVDLVRRCLEEHDLPGDALCFEITEHAVIEDVEQAVVALTELRSLGASIAIDDFGVGYSSLTQLKRLPVDTLKLDQSFVAGLLTDAADAAIVDATLALAKAFGLDVVAEGIESGAVAGHLIDRGCFRGQGFGICRPVPPVEITGLLALG